MTARLVIAILSTLMEEAALIVIWRWGLPQLRIQLSLYVLIGVMVAWGAYSVMTYRIGSRALRRKPLIGLPDMVGSKGKAVSPLAPEGFVRIRGELWMAETEDNNIGTGEQVTVVGQDGLKLSVRKMG